MKQVSYFALAFAVALGGCASVSPADLAKRTNAQLDGFAPPISTEALGIATDSPTALEAKHKAIAQYLATPLSADAAVRLSLLHSPALQRLLAMSTAQSAEALQLGRVANPVLGLERLSTPIELEIGRVLSFGLLDVLTLPKRQSMSLSAAEIAQQQLALAVVDHVTQVRTAWVNAVAAQQKWNYAQQSKDGAEASAELARRMQAVGNFNRLDRARQQAFYADATAQVAQATLQVDLARQALVRLLGLDNLQAKQLALPDRLPDTPKAAIAGDTVATAFTQRRLDLKLAQAQLDLAAKAQGLGAITTLADVELGVRRDGLRDTAEGTSSTRRGIGLSVRLPVFDSGNLQRTRLNAQTRAALFNLEDVVRSSSVHLQSAYSSYRTQHDLARHYVDEVLPLRKTISDENLLRYNGMFIGVFDLIADARGQIATVIQTIEAQQAFWLSEAALQAAIMGKPLAANAMPTGAAAQTSTTAAGGH